MHSIKKFVFGLAVLVILSSLTSAYTAPAYNNINLVLNSSYTAPTYSNINLVLGTSTTPAPTNSCTYSGTGNWAISSSDFCNITTNVDLGGNNISIIGEGITTLTANVTNFRNLLIQGINSTAIAKVICNGGCFV